MWWNSNPYTLLAGMQINAMIMESSMKIPQETKHQTAIWSSDTALGHISKGMLYQDTIDTCTQIFIAHIISGVI
jgi:hypothetical protein